DLYNIKKQKLKQTVAFYNKIMLLSSEKDVQDEKNDSKSTSDSERPASNSVTETSIAEAQWCGAHDLFNDLQFNTLVLDLRSNSKYRQGHVFGSYQLEVTKDYVKEKTNPAWVKLQDLPCDEEQKTSYKEQMNWFVRYVWVVVEKDWKEETKQVILPFLVTSIKKSRRTCVVKILNGLSEFKEMYPFLMLTFNDTYFSVMMLHSSKILSSIRVVPHYPNVIIPGKLYLGDAKSSAEGYIFKDLRLTHVVNTASRDVTNYFQDITILSNDFKDDFDNTTLEYLNQTKISYCNIEINDSQDVDIKQYFEKFLNSSVSPFFLSLVNFFHEGKVLVHCAAGISRSSTIVIAYLMKKLDLLLFDAMEYVKKCRPNISPNIGFFCQLMLFEEELFGDTKSSRQLLSANTEYSSNYHQWFETSRK
ncbi:hypothetical protein RFI_01070, partial [Reticulomyxa filosa]